MKLHGSAHLFSFYLYVQSFQSRMRQAVIDIDIEDDSNTLGLDDGLKTLDTQNTIVFIFKYRFLCAGAISLSNSFIHLFSFSHKSYRCFVTLPEV